MFVSGRWSLEDGNFGKCIRREICGKCISRENSGKCVRRDGEIFLLRTVYNI